MQQFYSIKRGSEEKTPATSHMMMTYNLDSLPSDSVEFSNKSSEEVKSQIETKKSMFKKGKSRGSKSVLYQKSSKDKSIAIKVTPELPKVLLVDDTVFNLMILKNILKINHNIDSDQAVSGEEAISLCQ